ncbi:hypothetical protein FDC49_19900 [Clostridium sporogenes]|uniref:hypothetical protein n=1 Tax=Clostridium sporogenes TaxID=1509 RepID=UPI0013D774CE|nr:hypothetical protein [Clostridium sporogenes]NFH34551.1 hypothetical protein [Clostridium sporogenes]NFL21959.1 hypothetical protein [Clostridium sporogenes]NFN74557.1 hypothetical protein [Clostridium sporogenes]NFV23989.1 hypothetical protein [Clostridium sporogenes]
MNKTEVTNVVNILIEKELSYSQVVKTIETALSQLKDCKIQNSNNESTESGNKLEIKNIVNINLDTKEITSSLSENLVQEIFNRTFEAQQSIFGDILSNKKTPVQNQTKKLDLSQVSVKDLADELVKHKDCVKELIPEPYEKYSISMEKYCITDLGPATILVIID